MLGIQELSESQDQKVMLCNQDLMEKMISTFQHLDSFRLLQFNHDRFL